MEFGEQIRQAREKKGMTQQTLAEQLYVTRQAVSRWERGERYRDILTTKRISDILGISLDQLFSGEKPESIAERNPVLENKFAKNGIIVLYAAVSVCWFITIIDVLLQTEGIDFTGSSADRMLLYVRVLRGIVEAVLFAYGCICSMKETLTPKRAGNIACLFWYAEALLSLTSWIQSGGLWLLLMIGIVEIIAGTACYHIFIKNDRHQLWRMVAYVTVLLGIIREFFSLIYDAAYSYGYYSVGMVVTGLLMIGIFLTIGLEIKIIDRKRRMVLEGL